VVDEEHQEEEGEVWLVEEVGFSAVEVVEGLEEGLAGIGDEGRREVGLEEAEGLAAVEGLHEGVAVDGVHAVVVVVVAAAGVAVATEGRSCRIQSCSHSFLF
jgi:hypothetical protein